MRQHIGKRLFLLGTMAIVLMLSAAACGGGEGGDGETAPTATIEGGGPVKFADTGWETNKISSAIGAFIVKHGYDYDTSLVRIAGQEDYEEKMVFGGVDVFMEMWQQNYEDWFAAERRRKVSVRGELYDEGSQGWYVPTYVITGGAAPDLVSVEDLAQYADALGGTFVSCPTTFNCAGINQIKLDAYGLSGAFTVQNPSTFEELTETMEAAYAAGEPIFAYYREPTWLMETQDWTRIEEPEANALCLARIRNVMVGTRESVDEGCAYPKAGVESGIYRGLLGRSEDLGTFFFNMTLGREGLMGAVRDLHENNLTLEQTAINYLKTHEDTWKGWTTTPEVAEKVSAALAAQ